MLGMIERMFSEISSLIGTMILKRNWMQRQDLIHYNLHEELDIKHSEDFFNIISQSYKESAENQYLIDQGLSLGAVLFSNLYKELYNNRKRKIEQIHLHPSARL